jgi:putative transposase
LRRALKKLKQAQQHLSRCQKGKHRRVRAVREVARLHRKVRNQRADFCHKAARRLINAYGTVVFEDLKVRNMVQNHNLALSISDAGWGQFVQCCVVKAESAGRQVLFVDPRHTSQNCSGCGRPQKLTLAERWYSCPECGTELDRDHNAARNILRLGWCAMSRTVVSLVQPEGTWRLFLGQ